MKNRKIPAPLVLALLGPLALGACAESTLAVNTSKRFGEQSGDPAARGVYKVGNPYTINGITYTPAVDYNYDETGIASWYGPGFHEKYTANGEVYDQNSLTAAHKTLPLPTFVRVTNLDNGRSMVLRINDRGPYAQGRIIDISRRGAQLLGFEQVGTAKVRVQVMAEESQQLAAAMQQRGRVQVASVQTQPGEPPPFAAPRNSVAAQPLAPPPAAQPAPPPPDPAQNQPAPEQTPVEVAALPAPPVPDPVGQVRQVAAKRTNIFVQAGAFANRDNASRLSDRLKAFGPAAVTPVTVAGQQLYRVRLGPLTSVEEGDRTLALVVNSGHPEARLIVD
ncbi:MAG: septal ring lytic transglycosylase RlpA family protein [Alphaproteobacteria bacterium]|nr:septal ring lytic transglycosylase RlpA family protein [Alphaproteobacteria bacterium]